DITFVDRYRESTKFMDGLVKEWELPIKVVNSDVMKFLSSAVRKWDYIFADPPYDMQGIGEFPGFLLQSDILTENGFFVLEHISTLNFSSIPGFKESRNYGQSVFSFFGQG